MAGLIREEDIAQVRERARIEEVVASYVTLRNAGGGSEKGLCPFHDEKSPSFHVTPSRNVFYCFGCGEGGDVIGFLQKIEGLGFSGAVERLAEKYGVQLRYTEGDGPAKPRRDTNLRPRLIEAHKVAGSTTSTGSVPRRGSRAGSSSPSAASTRPLPSASASGSRRATATRSTSTCARRASRTRSSSPAVWSRRASGVTTTGSAADCSGRSATPPATPSASARGGCSTTTGSTRST